MGSVKKDRTCSDCIHYNVCSMWYGNVTSVDYPHNEELDKLMDDFSWDLASDCSMYKKIE